MPYLSYVVKEALWLSPPGVLSLPYKTYEDVEIAGNWIPKNIEVKFNIYGAHWNPDQW